MKMSGWGVLEQTTRDMVMDDLEFRDAVRLWSQCTKQFPEDGPYLLVEPKGEHSGDA